VIGRVFPRLCESDGAKPHREIQVARLRRESLLRRSRGQRPSLNLRTVLLSNFHMHLAILELRRNRSLNPGARGSDRSLCRERTSRGPVRDDSGRRESATSRGMTWKSSGASVHRRERQPRPEAGSRVRHSLQQGPRFAPRAYCEMRSRFASPRAQPERRRHSAGQQYRPRTRRLRSQRPSARET
jgi:hypothetical protein